MKFGRLLLLLFLLSPTGCFLGYGVQNSVSSPLDAAQECVFRMRVRMMAREAWHKVRREEPMEGKHYSADYVKGFEDGFVDYIDAGGNGEPPATPCEHRRRTMLRTDAGPDKIDDWYAGFRHGAAVARESGLREWAVMPISQPPLTPTEAKPAQVTVPAPFVAPQLGPAVATAPAVAPEQALKIYTGRSYLMPPAPVGLP